MLEGRCKYRGPDGTKCAIGCLIPDEKYTPALEGKGSSSPIVRDALGLGGTEDDSLIRFLIELQQIHDSTPVESWNELLQRVALKYGLEPVETVSVDRSRWARAGVKKGQSQLLNEQGNMCCLGFAEVELGVPEGSLDGLHIPHHVQKRLGIDNLLTSPVCQTAVYKALKANDNIYISGAVREARIKEAFRNILNFEFKGLPDTLSDLLRVAVQDAMILEKTPGFKLNMSDWVLPFNGECQVCMAGASMVRQLDVDVTKYQSPGKEYGKLSAINKMRTGSFWSAAYFLDIEPTVAHTEVFNRARSLVKEAYDSSTGRAPWKVYQKASRMLREAGL